MKKEIEPTNAMYPLPVVLVTSGDGTNDNIITIAWTTNICRQIPCVGIVINGQKYSLDLINKHEEFAVNIPGRDKLREVDICGGKHGDKVDKFKLAGFTKEKAKVIKAALIKECPINIECRLEDTYSMETSHLLIGKVVNIHVDEKVLDGEGKIDFGKLNPVVYAQKTYFSLGESIAKRGFGLK
ncbi:MAG: flavin reductase family protein [Actinomycetota bacterium]